MSVAFIGIAALLGLAFFAMFLAMTGGRSRSADRMVMPINVAPRVTPLDSAGGSPAAVPEAGDDADG